MTEIPQPTLTSYPHINPREFNVGVEVRELPPDTALHPFKLLVSRVSGETQLRVNVGRALTTCVKDFSGTTYLRTESVHVPFSSSENLTNDVFGPFGVEGYEVLSPNTSYGVYILLSLALDTNGIPSWTLEHRNLRSVSWGCSGIMVTSDYTTPDAENDLALAEGVASALFLGRVDVDANGNGLPFQYRHSDIALPPMIVPSGFISQEAGNDLNASFVANPGLFAKVVSADTDNSISYGSDSGAYYNAP